MTHPSCCCNDVCVAFKGLRIFDVRCLLPYPTLIRVRIEVLFGSKMFEGCYDWSLKLNVAEENMLAIKELYVFLMYMIMNLHPADDCT